VITATFPTSRWAYGMLSLIALLFFSSLPVFGAYPGIG